MMSFLFNRFKLFIFLPFLLVFFAADELIATTISKNVIVFIKKDIATKITQPITIKVTHGETISFDSKQVDMIVHNSASSSGEFSFSSGGSVYMFFLNGDDVRLPDIADAYDYYVFYLTNHAQGVASDGDCSEEDEVIKTLLSTHSVVHIYDQNQWVVMTENHVDELIEYDETIDYIDTVLSHTEWSAGIRDQMLNYVKHQTSKLTEVNKINKRLYRDSCTSDDGFVVIDHAHNRDTSSNPLSDDKFFSLWTSLSSVVVDEDVHMKPVVEESLRNEFSQHSSDPWQQQVAELNISHSPHDQIIAEHDCYSNFSDKNNLSHSYANQTASTTESIGLSQASCQHDQELLIANPLSNNHIKDRVDALKQLQSPQLLEFGGSSYTQTHFIARSSEGTVRLAVDEKGQYVAIKSIFRSPYRPPCKQSENRETALLQSGQLEHPFAIRIIDIFQVNDFEYQVMPYLPFTLYDVRMNNDWPVEKSWLVLKQLLTIISFYHKNSITHRDIKPKNIMISADGASIKVTDFGTAKKVDESGMSQSIVGTLGFLTPKHVHAYTSKGVVNHFYADLAATALTLIFLEVKNVIFEQQKGNKALTNNDAFIRLEHMLNEFGWSGDSSAEEVNILLEKLFSKNNRVADCRLLKLLAKMLTSSSAGQKMASELLAEYFPNETTERKTSSAIRIPYQKIINIFRARGLAVENIPADGNCLYASIALAMKKNLTGDEYHYILVRMGNIEGERGGKITSQLLRHYLHNMLSRIITAIDEVGDTMKRETYRQQLTIMLGYEYRSLKAMALNGSILFSADNASQDQFWGDGFTVSSLLALGFNLNTQIHTLTGTAPELASFSALHQMYPDLIRLLQERSSIPTYYRRGAWHRPVMVVYAENNHYMPAFPLVSSEEKLLTDVTK